MHEEESLIGVVDEKTAIIVRAAKRPEIQGLLASAGGC
jgi:hypothetical protein